jgi:uncharacterized protein
MSRFEWDPKKAKSNLAKHGVNLADAVEVLFDAMAITIADQEHDEERWVTIGADAMNRILVVIYTWRGEVIRLISARKATRRERMAYEEHR